MLWFEIPRVVLELDWAVRLLLTVAILYHRRPNRGTAAWVTVVLAVPFLGSFFYLLVGENRLGSIRSKRLAELFNAWQEDYKKLTKRWPCLNPNMPEANEPLFRIAQAACHIPPIVGNQLLPISDSHEAFRRLAMDIDHAKESVWLSFYIWYSGGVVSEVEQALIRAAKRGVRCTMMFDDVGSKPFRNSAERQALEDAGVDTIALLPVGVLRLPFKRLDLRNHRKIAVIDDHIGYTGSLNMVDPDCYHAKHGIGKWIDVMVRVDGPAVEPLKMAILQDYCFERGFTAEHNLTNRPPCTTQHEDGAIVSVMPSGPGINNDAILQVVTSAMHAATQKLTLTTPYFVPDEATLTALKGAAMRGVETTLIVPKNVDSPLVHFAGCAFFDELLEAGVTIARYHGGLLHAKAMTIDGRMTIIGSANMDMRSFFINEEITLIVSDPNFTQEIDRIQRDYFNHAFTLDANTWSKRPHWRRLTERTLGLLGPVL